MTENAPRAAGNRVAAVDALRGLIMIVMALDHVRDFHHQGAMTFSPEDLTRTSAALFLTRWITHFCAPVFVFTAGLGAYFWLSRPGRTKGELTAFLLKRGLWLILLDLVVVRWAMFFSLTNGPVILLVLWMLGLCMIALGMLAHLPWRVLAVLSVAMVLLHNLADGVRSAQLGGAAWVWKILHEQGVIVLGPVVMVVAYPLVPWIGVMGAGFCFGRVMQWEPERRRKWMLGIGLGMTLAFVALRWWNGYGDPAPWSRMDEPVKTVLSFLRVTKYPASLNFLLVTLGPALMVLGWFDRLTFAAWNPLLVFGRVPLFYFVAHMLLGHLLAIPIALAKYGHAEFLWKPMPSMGGTVESYPPGFGVGLAETYAVWVVVVVLLYPVCLWFARLKERRREWWWLAYC